MHLPAHSYFIHNFIQNDSKQTSLFSIPVWGISLFIILLHLSASVRGNMCKPAISSLMSQYSKIWSVCFKSRAFDFIYIVSSFDPTNRKIYTMKEYLFTKYWIIFCWFYTHKTQTKLFVLFSLLDESDRDLFIRLLVKSFFAVCTNLIKNEHMYYMVEISHYFNKTTRKILHFIWIYFELNGSHENCISLFNAVVVWNSCD